MITDKVAAFCITIYNAWIVLKCGNNDKAKCLKTDTTPMLKNLQSSLNFYQVSQKQDSSRARKKWSCQCGPRQPSYEAKFGTSTTWQRRASEPAREMHVATSLGKQTRLRHTPWYAKLHRTAAPQSSDYEPTVWWLNCYSRIFSYEHYLELDLTTRYFWWWNIVALNVSNDHYFLWTLSNWRILYFW